MESDSIKDLLERAEKHAFECRRGNTVRHAEMLYSDAQLLWHVAPDKFKLSADEIRKFLIDAAGKHLDACRKGKPAETGNAYRLYRLIYLEGDMLGFNHGDICTTKAEVRIFLIRAGQDIYQRISQDPYLYYDLKLLMDAEVQPALKPSEIGTTGPKLRALAKACHIKSGKHFLAIFRASVADREDLAGVISALNSGLRPKDIGSTDEEIERLTQRYAYECGKSLLEEARSGNENALDELRELLQTGQVTHAMLGTTPNEIVSYLKN
jgi:hypothetical protein